MIKEMMEWEMAIYKANIGERNLYGIEAIGYSQKGGGFNGKGYFLFTEKEDARQFLEESPGSRWISIRKQKVNHRGLVIIKDASIIEIDWEKVRRNDYIPEKGKRENSQYMGMLNDVHVWEEEIVEGNNILKYYYMTYENGKEVGIYEKMPEGATLKVKGRTFKKSPSVEYMNKQRETK